MGYMNGRKQPELRGILDIVSMEEEKKEKKEEKEKKEKKEEREEKVNEVGKSRGENRTVLRERINWGKTREKR